MSRQAVGPADTPIRSIPLTEHVGAKKTAIVAEIVRQVELHLDGAPAAVSEPDAGRNRRP